MASWLNQTPEGSRAELIRPLIAFNVNQLGLGTRYLTPVTHPDISEHLPSGLSQHSLKQMNQGRTLTGLLEPREFRLFGYPISHSRSPAMHNAIFRYFGLPHSYTLFESKSLDVVQKAIRDPSFGGASVTMPFKQSILPLLDSLSEPARSIGAVNTIIRLHDDSLRGDNTDWLGVLGCLRRVSAKTVVKGSSALVLGAGGTARSVVYALQQFGITKIQVYNRSPGRLEEFMSSFPGVTGLSSVSDVDEPADFLVDTLPPTAGICTAELVRAVLPPEGGVFVKLAYYGPVDSGIKTDYGPNTKVVTGFDVVVEQGLWQSQKWTGLRLLGSESFRKAIQDVVLGREAEELLPMVANRERNKQRPQ